MKYIRKTSKNFTEDFLINLLIDRGILENDSIFQKKFFNPTLENLINPENLDHMEEGYQLLLKHLKAGSKIYLCVDSDVDGFTSSAIFYNYLIDHLNDKYNFTIEYHIPEGKEHGLRTLIPLLTEEKKCDLIVLPDSSSNDYEEHKILKEMGYDILVLDHHEAERYSENAVVINNQLSQNYENKALSGVGVVYKFFSYFDKKEGLNFANQYLDLVALGEISDMMNMETLENRFICDYGLSHIKNGFFREIIKKQCYSLFGIKAEQWTDYYWNSDNLTQIGIAFYVTPLINALIRVGSSTEKERLFIAFINPNEKVPSTKRGHKAGEMETISENTVRNCNNAKTRQNKEKEKAMELLDIQIIENCLDNNKILILNADELDIANTLTGLCAMGVAAEHKKPVMLGRIGSDGYLKGSIRGREGSELKDFKSLLLKSGLMEFVEGHANAAGFSIKASKVPNLLKYANKELMDVNFNEGFYEADFVVNGNCSYLDELIEDLDGGKTLYGQANDEPIVIIENITLPAKGYSIIGSNLDTLRFEFNGITYVKFKAKELIDQLSNYTGSLKLNVAGKPNINEWGGRRKPQILVEEIEVKENSLFEF